MADGRFEFPFLSFILGLISNLIACFQENLALLILQFDYSRRRQNIIGLLSLPMWRSWKLDLSLVWLCFCFDFDILNCFCDFKELHIVNPHQRNSMMRQFIISRAHNSEHVWVKHVQSGELSFSNRFIVYVWTVKNDAKTLRVHANFLENGERKLRFQTNADTCGQGLNLNKSFIGVPSRCIKLAYPFIREALTTIYNQSLQQGTVPDILKISKISPIDKRGYTTDPANYSMSSFSSTCIWKIGIQVTW